MSPGGYYTSKSASEHVYIFLQQNVFKTFRNITVTWLIGCKSGKMKNSHLDIKIKFTNSKDNETVLKESFQRERVNHLEGSRNRLILLKSNHWAQEGITVEEKSVEPRIL